MAVIATQGTGGGAKPKVPKDATFVDLERGIQTTQGANLDQDIGDIKAITDACFLVMLGILVAVGIVIFIKFPIWPAVRFTSFAAYMMFMVALLVIAFRDNYIEKRMLENGRAPN